MTLLVRLRRLLNRRKPKLDWPQVLDWSYAYIVTDQGTYWRRGGCSCRAKPCDPVDDE